MMSFTRPEPAALLPGRLVGRGIDVLELYEGEPYRMVGRLNLNRSPWVYEDPWAGSSLSAQVMQGRYRFEVRGSFEDRSRFLLVVEEDDRGDLSASVSKTHLIVLRLSE
jgi:hypothetical protein